MTTHTIYEGDVLDGLRTLPKGCVQCTVTSPPYYGLRNYGVDRQIGLEETPEQFIQKIVEVFREVRRVTRDDGTLWLNFGDSYWGGKGSNACNDTHIEDRIREGRTLQRAETRIQGMKVIPTNRTHEMYKAKDLMGIPWRVAFALQADGWYFRSAMPWIKRNCMPESTTDRPTSAIEYVFLFAKSAKYFYDGEAIRCPSSESYQNDSRPANVLRQRVNKKSKYPNEGQFKKMAALGTSFPGHSGILKAGGTPFCDGITRNYRNSDPFFESWQGLYSENGNPLAFIINPQARPELHFATFPDLLAETCIKAGTSEYGCCPKCGAPWERIIEAKGGVIGGSWHPHEDDDVTGQVGFKDDGTYRREFKGWQPTCKCGEQERVPCVVLDPFMGSGTVAEVARDLGRSSIGCELNPEYVKIIRKRLKVDSCLDTGTVEYHFKKVSA